MAQQCAHDNPNDNYDEEYLTGWQPLGLIARRLARRLALNRERAVLEFEAAGINVEVG